MLNPIKKSCIGTIFCALATLMLAVSPVCFGQATQAAAGMTGVVTDQSGAVIPNVAVTLTNAATGFKLTQTTNSIGVYRFADVPPGQGYEAVFTGNGFDKVDVQNIYLNASTVRTQNETLAVGAHQTIQVNASTSEVTINTTDAVVGDNIDVKKLNNLPVLQRNDPIALFIDQPGTTDTGSVTGARVDQNNVTVDGLDTNDFATGGAMQSNTGPGVTSGFTVVGHAPVDSLEEVHVGLAGNGADGGVAGGGQFQLVTKSGTNKFHGDLNEYHRDPSLVANSWFSNNANPIVPRNHLIQNQFGGSIGGPIKRDKAFFFFDYSNSRIISGTLVQRTVLTDSFRNGNVGYYNSSSTPANPQVSYLTPGQVQAIDPEKIGADTTWLNGVDARFPKSNNRATGDGINSSGYNFNAPNDDYATSYVSRIDYNLNSGMKLWGRFTIARENAVENPNEFGGDPATDPFVD
ncbi:MAG TPA: carboxypeptidase-like regulatory domain-containing protein, partial [Acidobacteriaceae bacterium]|nr:carboxypeptidase-like regulatory domain-containing protein [Acidobacteriaceae bacterium]